MQPITFKPGDDIDWIGKIERAGVDDFTGWTLASQVREKPAQPGQQMKLLANAEVAWVDPVAGIFSFRVPRATTQDWPQGATLLVDVVVTNPDDKRTRTETGEFKTVPGVTKIED